MHHAIRRHPVMAVFLAAFILRLVSIGVVAVVGADTFGVGDDATYSFLAEGMAEGRAAAWDPYTRELYNSTATFTLPLTLIQLAFGSVAVGGPLLAASCGALTAGLVTRLAMEVTSLRWALLAGLGVASFPSQVLWSSFTLKDSTVWAVLAALAVIVAVGSRTHGRRLVWTGVGVVFLLLLVAHLRTHTFVVATWAVAVASVFSTRGSRAYRVTGALLIALALPWLLGLGPAALPFALEQDVESRRTANAVGAATAFVPAAPTEDSVAVQEEIQRLEEQLAALESGSTSPPANVPTPSPSDGATASPSDGATASPSDRETLVRQLETARARLHQVEAPAPQEDEVLTPTIQHLPKGLSVMLLEPYPWQPVSNPRVRLVQLEMLLWYPILAAGLLGLVLVLRDAGRRRAMAFPVVAGAGILLVYALAEGNFGTAYRHRGEFVWVVFLLAAVGASWLARRRASPGLDRRAPVEPPLGSQDRLEEPVPP